MSAQVCPCCGWTVLLSESLPDDTLAVCPECGQCLRVPPPWSDKDIAICDTQGLARLTLSELDRIPGSGDRPPVPAELSVRRLRPAGAKNPGSLAEGLMGIGLGLAILAGAVWSSGQGGHGTWWAAFEGCVALLLIVGGIYVVRIRLRRRRRIASARVVSLASDLSTEGYYLGTPLAYHRAKSSAQGISLLIGGLVLAAGILSLVMFLQGVQRFRLLEVALLGIPGGLIAMVQAVYWRGQRVLVCPKGLVLCRGNRWDVWRWDSVVDVWLKPEPVLKPLTAFTCRLRRDDGEECVLSPRTDFFENQVVVRAQAEVAAQLLPQWRQTLRGGGSLDFGVFELTADGLHKNGQYLPVGDLTAWRLDAEQWTIQTEGGQTFRWPIASVPNLAALLTLLRELCRAACGTAVSSAAGTRSS